MKENAGVAGAIAKLAKEGYTAEFKAEADGLSVTGSEAVLRPEEVTIRDYFRFEGASDPDDMAVVYALETGTGTRGVLVDAFGSYSDPEVAAMLERMPVNRP
jgi:hypothetical protein